MLALSSRAERFRPIELVEEKPETDAQPPRISTAAVRNPRGASKTARHANRGRGRKAAAALDLTHHCPRRLPRSLRAVPRLVGALPPLIRTGRSGEPNASRWPNVRRASGRRPWDRQSPSRDPLTSFPTDGVASRCGPVGSGKPNSLTRPRPAASRRMATRPPCRIDDFEDAEAAAPLRVLHRRRPGPVGRLAEVVTSYGASARPCAAAACTRRLSRIRRRGTGEAPLE